MEKHIGLIYMISTLYASSESSVLVNNQIGDPFSTTVGVFQGCLLSPVLFNIFVEKIMPNTLKDHDSTPYLLEVYVYAIYVLQMTYLIEGSSNELKTHRLTYKKRF